MFLDSLNYPSLVVLCEHWLKPEEALSIPNYILLSKFCRSVTPHGGSAILINREFLDLYSFKNVCKFNDLLEEKTFEMCIVYCSRVNVYVLGIYRAPLSSVAEFMLKLEAVLLRLPSASRVILAGDLNMDYLNSFDQNTQQLSSLLNSFNLTVYVGSPTRVTSHSATLIDYLCGNFVTKDVECHTVNAGLSDHEAVLCSFTITHRRAKRNRRKGRLFTRQNYGRFWQLCIARDWGTVLTAGSPLQSFHSLMCEIFNRSFPLKYLKERVKKPWLTNGIRTSAKNMRSLHYIRKFHLSNDIFMSYFLRYRHLYREVIRMAKQKYYKNRIMHSNNKPREAWRIVGELRGRNAEVNVDSNLSPDELNDFYCSIAMNISSKIKSDIDFSSFMGNVAITRSFFFTPVTLHELKDTISDVRSRNSSGWDGISVKMFAGLPDDALEVLAECVNLSFTSGDFPDCLKVANIVPLYKGGDEDCPSNYRPIALLPTLSKIFEKLVKKRILAFISREGILRSAQFGFQSGKGTSDAIFSFLERLYLTVNDREAAAAVFCDLTKAFDCVSHRILLQKLEIYGFRGNCHDWFRSYLNGRVQSVAFGGSVSGSRNLGCGVPQGSVLGPILFLLYVNDLVDLDIAGKFTVFADDATILWCHRDPLNLNETVNKDLRLIKEWCDANKLCFNVSKTSVMSFKCRLDNIYLENTIINNLSENKFLGLHIDDRLKFDVHVRKLITKLSSNCYAMRVMSKSLDMTTVRGAYFALIEAHLRYGLVFWGSCTGQLFRTVFVLQKRALRCMCKAKVRDTCRPLFMNQNILTLPSLLILETVCLLHKKHKLDFRSESAYNTRQSHFISLPIPSSSRIRDSFVFNGRQLFNHLPLYIRKIYDGQRFKREVKGLLVARAYYNVDEFLDEGF